MGAESPLWRCRRADERSQRQRVQDAAILRVGDLFPASGTPAARPNIFSPAKDLPDPYYQRWNFNVQRELVGMTGIEIGYLGSRGHYLAKRVNLNQATRDVNPAQPTPLLSPSVSSFRQHDSVHRAGRGIELSRRLRAPTASLRAGILLSRDVHVL